MGKKPVIAWTGMILATLSLAGCKCCGSKSCNTCNTCANGSCATPAATQPGQLAANPNAGQPLPQGAASSGYNNVSRPQIRTVDNTDRAYGTMNGMPMPTTVNGSSPTTMRPTGAQPVGYGVPTSTQPAPMGAAVNKPTYSVPAPTVTQTQPAPDWTPSRQPLPPTAPSVEESAAPARMPAQPVTSSSPLQHGTVTETSYPVMKHETAPVVEPQLELPPAP